VWRTLGGPERCDRQCDRGGGIKIGQKRRDVLYGRHHTRQSLKSYMYINRIKWEFCVNCDIFALVVSQLITSFESLNLLLVNRGEFLVS